MFKQKKISVFFCIFFSFCITLHGMSFAQNNKKFIAANRKSTVNSNSNANANSNSNTNYNRNTVIQRPVIQENVTVIQNKIVRPHRYHNQLWGGVAFLFTLKPFQNYLPLPLYDYQVGMTQSLYHVRQHDFWYGALIFDFTHIQKKLLSGTQAVNYFDTFYFSNAQLLLGYEQSLGTQYISLFLEAGGVFQERIFAILQSDCASTTDYIYGFGVGGSFNGGINLSFMTDKQPSIRVRLSINAMIGAPIKQTLSYNGQEINTNPFIWGPAASLVFRL